MRKKGNFHIFTKNEQKSKREKNGPKLKKKGYMVFREIEKNKEKRREKKKTEHTNIALKTLRQNIHVMLSYAKIYTTNKTKKKK